MITKQANREMMEFLKTEIAKIDRVIDRVKDEAFKAGMLDEDTGICGDYGYIVEGLEMLKRDRHQELNWRRSREREDDGVDLMTEALNPTQSDRA